MLIKPRSRLTARDLPFVESPHLAARRVRRAMAMGASPELRFDPGEIPGLPIYSHLEATRARLLSALETGQLMLVLDPRTSSGPINPPVSWRPESPISAGGRWVSDSASMPFPLLAQELDRLNRLGETPESLTSFGSMGLTPTQAGQGAGAMDAQEASGTMDRKLVLPIGVAASVAPIAQSWPLDSRDGPEKTELPLRLTIGLFMDGTLNNVDNIKLFEQRVERECLKPLSEDPERLEACRDRLRLLMGESYANSPTNVVKLFDSYRASSGSDSEKMVRTVKVYQQGVGTESGEEDSFLGMATGLGDTGIEAQVRQAFEKAAIALKDASKGVASVELTFDFFGFSRGAAAARHAVNQVLTGRIGQLGKALADMSVPWPDKTDVRFVGLFDTVAGVVNPKALDFSASNDRNAPVDINLDFSEIGNIVHLTALDERRANFSLNSLCTMGGQLPSHVREIALPGAHSDIGGGYPDSQVEDLLLSPILAVEGSSSNWPEQTMEWDQLQSLCKAIEEEGWVGEQSIQSSEGNVPQLAVLERRMVHPVPDGRTELSLKMKRLVRGEYSRICFRLMHHLASSKGVPFDQIDESDSLLKVPAELGEVKARIEQQVLSGVDSPELDEKDCAFLKQRYIHYSDHFNALEFLVGSSKIRTEVPFDSLYPFKPTRSRRRIVHPKVY